MLKRQQIAKLRATGKVADIEDEALDDGRFFVHLKQLFVYDKHEMTRSRSFGGYREAMRAAKRAETAWKKAEAKRQQLEAEAAERLAKIMEGPFGALIERSKPYMEIEFIADVIGKLKRFGEISEKQSAAVTRTIEKIEAEASRKQGANWIGRIGDKLETTAEVVFTTQYWVESYSGYGSDAVYITVLRTEDGNTLKVKSGAFATHKGVKMKIAGRVKGHEDYKGEKQTVLSHVKVKEIIYDPENETVRVDN